jgi:hypothetical protein
LKATKIATLQGLAMAGVAMVVGLGVGVAAPSQADSSAITACTIAAGGHGLKYDLSVGGCGKTQVQLQWPTESAFSGLSRQVTSNTSELGTIQSKQRTDDSNIAANTSAITSIQSQQTTDENDIAANASAISALRQTSGMADEVAGYTPSSSSAVTIAAAPTQVASLKLTTPSRTANETALIWFSGDEGISAGGTMGCELTVNGTTIDATTNNYYVSPSSIAAYAEGVMSTGMTVDAGATTTIVASCQDPNVGVMLYPSLTAVILPKLAEK